MSKDKLNVLVVGSGGREHALVHAISKSPRAGKLYSAKGNGGTAELAERVDLKEEDGEAIASFAQEHDIDLLVIGPEAPLVAGVADVVRAQGIPVFGPGAKGARLEGSKRFAKEIMQRAGVLTAAWKSCTSEQEAVQFIQELGGACVVKADGLAAGKGVVVAESEAEALEAVQNCFAGAFGEAGAEVVIEELLEGPECSLLVLTDGKTVLPLATAQDHKRALEGDLGPNTGGMGVYSPVPIVSDEEYKTMLEAMHKVVDQLQKEGIDYRGCLYGGFMLTKKGPQVLEFNARFGDPETEVILPRLKSDALEALYATAKGELASYEANWSDDWALGVVLTSKGYPGSYQKGFEISGLEALKGDDQVVVYHAGTELDKDGVVKTSGGRVLCIVARGLSFDEARERAYAAVDKISFDGCTYRRDIGERARKGLQAW